MGCGGAFYVITLLYFFPLPLLFSSSFPPSVPSPSRSVPMVLLCHTLTLCPHLPSLNPGSPPVPSCVRMRPNCHLLVDSKTCPPPPVRMRTRSCARAPASVRLRPYVPVRPRAGACGVCVCSPVCVCALVRAYRPSCGGVCVGVCPSVRGSVWACIRAGTTPYLTGYPSGVRGVPYMVPYPPFPKYISLMIHRGNKPFSHIPKVSVKIFVDT